MESVFNTLLKLLYRLLGLLFLAIIILCLFTLGKFLYSYPIQQKTGTKEKELLQEKFSKTIQETIGADHFHILDETVYSDMQNAPLCLRCHGNFCHVKSEKLRAYYNMHTFFLACETCHLRPAGGEEFSFDWFDDRTGKTIKELQGEHGNYGAKIVPVKQGIFGTKRLDALPEEKLALRYLKLQDTYTEEEKRTIQKQLMRHISEEEVTCKECHCRDSYLNYKALGYSEKRSEELSRIEIAKMVQEYETFFLPAMID